MDVTELGTLDKEQIDAIRQKQDAVSMKKRNVCLDWCKQHSATCSSCQNESSSHCLINSSFYFPEVAILEWMREGRTTSRGHLKQKETQQRKQEGL